MKKIPPTLRVRRGPKSAPALGRHTLLEFSGCDPDRLRKVRGVRSAMMEAARRADGTIVRAVFHSFSPWGVSGVVVISESHLTIHTWPEHQFAAVDVFSCGPRLCHEAVRRFLKEALRARRVTGRVVLRGRGVPGRPGPA